ncbi:MAG: gluconate 2-dehydrogenase subunit 3 family protein [Acidobacteriota bacterium]
MSDNKITRREAIKDISAGVGVIATLPVLGGTGWGRALDQDHAAHLAQRAAQAKPYALKFFTPEENRALIEMCEQIIPADDHSPGARAARVNEYIDTIVNVSPDQTKQAWRAGLRAINKKSQDMFGKPFADSTPEQQVQLLTGISRNERNPQTEEEQFFRRIKNATIDGYYTSEIGIHQELKYKGNTFLKEFPGCTHPEHQ